MRRNRSTGGHSIPFGATPVCPWISSQNSTPLILTLSRRLVNDEVDNEPQALSTSRRAALILSRLKPDAMQRELGNLNRPGFHRDFGLPSVPLS